MNSFLITIFSFFFLACTTNSSSFIENGKIDKEEVFTGEENLITIYNQLVVPLFEAYNSVDIPTTFKISPGDLSINAGASFGYVEVSQGLVNLKKEAIQIFTLAHEIAHIVTLKQAAIFNLGESIPRGVITNDYKKAEYLADLIAIHLIKTKLPEKLDLLIVEFDYLENLLGTEIFTHPSGKDRIKLIKAYVKENTVDNKQLIFKKYFVKMWEME